MSRIIVGECYENHSHERDDGKYEQTYHRQRKKRHMEFVIKKIAYILPEGLRFLTDNMILLQLVAFLGCTYIANDEEKDNEQSEYSI